MLLRLVAVLLIVPFLMAPSCSDFERGTWQALRTSDAAVESLTTDWEKWKGESPRRFTDTELENLRAALFAANEAVSSGESAFSSYWNVKKLAAQDLATPEELAAAKQSLVAAVESAKQAVASARSIWTALQKKTAAADTAPPFESAAFDWALFLMLLGEFAGAVLGGKKGAISEAAANLIAATVEANQEAGGEDIDLALPALRDRIAARRARLAPPAATGGESQS